MEPIITQTRISAPPDVVRAKLLDFPSLASSKPTFIQSIKILDKSKSSLELVPGDKLRCILGGRTLNATVATNTSSGFSWTGTIMGLLHGEHQFRFESVENGQATDFFHEERFTGPLSWMMDDNFLARKIGQRVALVKSYESFNADFKTWVESRDQMSLSNSSI